MARAPYVLTATVVGTAGLLAFHPHAPAARLTTASKAPVITSPTARTATGDSISTRYGSAQVSVTVDKGKIVAIQPLQLQDSDSKSVEISSFAAPLLEQSALAKQSADVDVVSGATYTSASYSQSLQSALDKLGYSAPDGSRATLQVP